MPLEEAPKGFKIFNDKDDNCVKVVLRPQASAVSERPPASAAASLVSPTQADMR